MVRITPARHKKYQLNLRPIDRAEHVVKSEMNSYEIS